MGNVGAMNIFEVGEPDAKAVASYVRPGFEAEDLMSLGKYKMATVMRYQGERLPAGSTHHPGSTNGCTLYVKTGYYGEHENSG